MYIMGAIELVVQRAINDPGVEGLHHIQELGKGTMTQLALTSLS
jgi:hypothetical protein